MYRHHLNYRLYCCRHRVTSSGITTAADRSADHSVRLRLLFAACGLFTTKPSPCLRCGQPSRQLQQERRLSHPGVPAKHHHAAWHQPPAEHAREFGTGQRHSLLLLGCTNVGTRAKGQKTRGCGRFRAGGGAEGEKGTEWNGLGWIHWMGCERT